ncbi:MAG: hypothetical protein JNL72_04945 [Flavipsychrobacter sp.]|nr:hypothetical protein [Flavipsychrobacter sp.]
MNIAGIMIKRIKLIGVAMFIIIFSCKNVDNQTLTTDKFYSVAADLAGIRLDTFQRDFRLQDSAQIHSLDLTFYEFSPIDYYPAEKYTIYNLIIQKDGNKYLLQRCNPGGWFVEAEQFFSKTMNSDLIPRKVDWLRIEQIPLELKIESILNNSPRSVKDRYNRKTLDSFFKYSIAYPIASKPGKYRRNVLIRTKKELDEYFSSPSIDRPGQTEEYRNEFRAFLDSNLLKENFFIYKNANTDDFVVITINEEFQDAAAGERFYLNYSWNDILFIIRIYTYRM